MNRRGQRYEMPFSQPSAPDLNQRGAQYGAANDPAPGGTWHEKVHKITGQIDERLGDLGHPIKPYLPALGRLLVVITFLEDAFRIVTQWRDQVRYLWRARGLNYYFTMLFLVVNVVLMAGGSYSVVSKRKLVYGVGALVFVVVSQALAYGLIFDLQFFFRNLSLIGGLLLVVSDVFVQDRRRIGLPGLPQLDNKDRARYFTLAGRVLLLFLFLGHLCRTKWTFGNSITNLVGLVCCAMVAVGFKARLSASLLSVLLFVQNLTTNSYWRVSAASPDRDFLRYEYFQTLSIVGGMILLVNMGAGRISLDEKKKIY